MKTPCRDCPFRASSQLGYDEDAMKAFHEGETPACHADVGMDRIFEHVPLEPRHPCTGYAAWLAGANGYREPEKA